jgi:hypothetical protein
MHALQLRAPAALIGLCTLTTLRPHGIRTILQLELGQPLTKAKDMLRENLKVNLNVFILIDESLSISINYGFACSRICELERERLLADPKTALVESLLGVMF